MQNHMVTGTVSSYCLCSRYIFAFSAHEMGAPLQKAPKLGHARSVVDSFEHVLCCYVRHAQCVLYLTAVSEETRRALLELKVIISHREGGTGTVVLRIFITG